MLAITANCEDAEDCLQEALINAYRALSSFRGESAFSTWLYRIALNTARNWIRNESRKAATRLQHCAISESASIAIACDECALVRRALLSLPDHYRGPLLLRRYQNMTYEEIARVLHLPIGNVRSRLAQGRAMLAGRLRALEYTHNFMFMEVKSK